MFYVIYNTCGRGKLCRDENKTRARKEQEYTKLRGQLRLCSMLLILHVAEESWEWMRTRNEEERTIVHKAMRLTIN